MAKKFLIVWAYAIELIAAALIMLLLGLLIGTPTMMTFIVDTANDFATVFSGVMLAAALGFLWTLYSKSDTDFYQWLESKGAFAVYLHACMYAVAVYALSACSLITIKHVKSNGFMWATFFLLILAVLNLYTLIKNVCDLMRLTAKFQQLTRH